MEKDQLINAIVSEAQKRGADTEGFADKLYIIMKDINVEQAETRLALTKYLSDRKDKNPYIFPKSIIFTSENGIKCRGCREWYKFPETIADGKRNTSSIEATVRKIGKRAGVENTHPHRFRRTSATFALRRGMPLEMVSKMLGHENLATTQIYLDLTEEELEAAHKKYVI